jgi:TonB family protein
VPAIQLAPPAPTAEDWAFAASYRLKNSKGYRHHWGRQVRSMMGTAVEGPEQGLVRFRVEIAPDGRVARVDTLWSTSPTAERLAREAIAALPPLPPTPTGQPLVFERTIAFTPLATEDDPVYKNDCRPDPPGFRTALAWAGRSPPGRAEAPVREPQDPQALADCQKQLPRDTVDAEGASDRRKLERGWSSQLRR